ncbi:MAG: ribosome assembly RNA-binding protein YhbY [Gammaproteobacteria bacterium]|nr:ribosome assembly RNA-binding protein YhbY [Gammaproteobacteria bacterium]
MTTAAGHLSEKQRKHLRGLAHTLRPVSRLGSAGVTDAFLAEFEAALAHHELIKLKVTAATRTDRNAAIEAVAARTGATLVARIGNVAVLYRPCPTGARLELPPA